MIDFFLAVFASSISRIMAKQLPSSEESAMAAFNEFADFFEDRAIILLNACTKIFPDFKWLISGLRKATWCCSDMFEVAYVGGCVRFMGTIEVQDLMYRTWTNGIQSSPGSILLAILFPPLIASKRFVNWNRSEQMTSKQIQLRRIPVADIGQNIGNDRFEVRQPTSYCQKFYRVYSSVESKFTLRVIAYLPFLMFATYTIFYDLPPDYHSPAEISLFVFLLAQFLDIAISTQVGITLYDPAAAGTMLRKFIFFWYELVLFIEFLVVVFLRAFFSGSFKITKTVTGVLLITLFFRIFIYARISRRLGPFMTTIKKMLIVTLVFTLFIVVAIFPSGVTQQALLFPRRDDPLGTTRDVFFFDFYRLFGELSLEYSHGELDGCAENSTSPDCPSSNPLVPAIVAFYMLFANIFLLNVLIAVFSNVIEETENKAIEMWKFTNSLEIIQYRRRWILPPPFNLLEVLVRFGDIIYYMVNKESLFIPRKPKPPSPKIEENTENEFIDEQDSNDESEEKVAEYVVSEAQEAWEHALNAVQHRARNYVVYNQKKEVKMYQVTKGKKINEKLYEVLNEADDIVETLCPKIRVAELNEEDEQPETPVSNLTMDKAEAAVTEITQNILKMAENLAEKVQNKFAK